jgi:hypothetical protein
MPVVAGRPGPPARESSETNSTVPSGAVSPTVLKLKPWSRTASQTPTSRSTRSALPCNVMPAPDTFQSDFISAMLTPMPALRSRTARLLPAMPPPAIRRGGAGLAGDQGVGAGGGVLVVIQQLPGRLVPVALCVEAAGQHAGVLADQVVHPVPAGGRLGQQALVIQRLTGRGARSAGRRR